jgi:DNA-binding MarR family transcriptional regulator
MRNTVETRAFIGAVYECDGSASTREIRRRIDLTDGQIHHQYNKLEDHGWITVSKPESHVTPSGSRMKVATLTEKALDEIENKAYLSDGQQPERTHVGVVELAEQLDELQATIEVTHDYVSTTLFRRMKENSERLEALEARERSSE